MKSLAKTVHRCGQLIALLFLVPLANVTYAADEAAVGAVEEIVVTGSFIKGSAEDAALPVDVITAESLEDVGNPSMIEFIRSLGITSGILAETNQFTSPAQGTEGITTINLRGLGSGRTLTLINGRRQVTTESFGVDVSAFPMRAFGRTEILKDGAAALYGSDAIAGVVNFITREGFEGFEISGSNNWLEESDGNQEVSILYGWAGERTNAFMALEYDHRSELKIKDMSWGVNPFAFNTNGGWSTTGMPGTTYLFNPNLPVRPGALPGTNQNQYAAPDPQCAALGGEVFVGLCSFQFTQFDNLVEDQNTYKSYGEINYDLTDSSKLHFEAMYSRLDMPNWKSSPAYPPNSLFGPDRIVPADNPGLIDYKARYPALFAVLPAGETIDSVEVYQRSRMLGVNGRDGKPLSAYRKVNTYRVATSLVGDAFDGGLGYNVGVAYSHRERTSNGYDMQVQGMAFALHGLGGPGCTPGGSDAATSTPGVGPCMYYNPFSTAIQFSAVNGATNPTFVPGLANPQELIDWLTLEGEGNETNELLVWDVIFNGETPFELPGGNIGWAAGFQARNEKYDLGLNDVSNVENSPCPWTNPVAVDFGFVRPEQLSPNCNIKFGLVAFGVPNNEVSTKRTVYAFFGELAVPISDTVDMQLALRFEDYGSEGGSTVDPKVAMKWQATDWFALRGSIGTTFRGPPLSYLSGVSTVLANIPAAAAYRAVNYVGNSDLEPERATASNAGMIFEIGGFMATIDYWNFNFSDPIQLESAGQILAAYDSYLCADFYPAPGGGQVPGAGIGTAACNDLRPRFVPLGTSTAGMESVDVFFMNGSKIKTDGVDVAAQYAFALVGGELTVGTEGTYTIKYDSDDFNSINGTLLAPGGDFAGYENIAITPFYPLPKLKGNLFARYAIGELRLAYTYRYVEDFQDLAAPLEFKNIDSMNTQDFTAIYTLGNVMVAGSVFNLTDEDPPQVYQALNYDPYTHNPFGRMFKLELTYTLGAR